MENIPFFSVVIPAHNEEGYLGPTLARLAALEYPRDQYEVIVVENGSTDQTLTVALDFKDRHPELAVCIRSSKEAGVSKARNQGAHAASPKGDWVLFLDADTLLDAPFLHALARYLAMHEEKGLAAGTVWLEPLPSTIPMRTVYGCINLTFMLTRAAYGGALLIRRPLLDTVRFDEQVHVSEDTAFIAEAKKHGAFFFFRTRFAHTSTRRFQNGGWKKMPVWVSMWAFGMMAPYHASIASSIQRRFKYKVIR